MRQRAVLPAILLISAILLMAVVLLVLARHKPPAGARDNGETQLSSSSTPTV
jgi:hypothetical protein